MPTGDIGFGRPPVPSMLAQFGSRDPLSRLRGEEDRAVLNQLASVPGLSLGSGLPHAPGEPDDTLQIIHDGQPVEEAPPAPKPSRSRSPAVRSTPPAAARPPRAAEKRIVFAFSRDPEQVTVNLKDAKGDVEYSARVPFTTAAEMLPVLQRLAKIEDLTGELSSTREGSL